MRAPVHASASDCPLPKARRHVGHGHLLAPTRMGVNRNADQPPCLPGGGPRVRISLPPAESQSLSRVRFRRSRTRAFRAAGEASLARTLFYGTPAGAELMRVHHIHP